MKNLIKKFVAGMSAVAVLMFGSSLPIPKAEDPSAQIVANAALGEAENFLGTGTDSSGVTIYNTNSKYSFNMNGRSCYQGIVFDDSKSTAQITYDISDIDTLLFTVGHVDNTSSGNATAKFFLDGDEYDSFTMYWTMPLMEYELDCSFADSLQIIIERDGASSYAFTDVTVDGISAARPSKAPEYKSAEDFLNNSFAGTNVRVGNVDSREPDFYMNGRGYHQGIVFFDSQASASVCYNVENINSIKFTVGHIDNSSTASNNAIIYLDDREYDKIPLYWNMNLIDYELDVSNVKNIRIEIIRGGWGADSCGYAFGDISVDDYDPVRKYEIAEHDTIESFLNGGYGASNIWVANPESVNPDFYMNGRGYYQGLVFSDVYGNSTVNYNVENINLISFTIGHVDNTGDTRTTVKLYLDDNEVDSIDLFWNMPLKKYNLDVSNAKVLRIVVPRSGWGGDECSYAFAEFSIDSNYPIRLHSIPKYNDSYDFLQRGFEATAGTWIPNIEAKEPEFYMSEQGFFQGVVFPAAKSDDRICYNVENLNSISFTIGHIDSSENGNATLSFFLDSKNYSQLELKPDMENTPYTIDVSNASVLQINISRDQWGKSVGYALADVSIVPKEIKGDCNNDGKFTVADAVLLQKWLLAVPDTKLADWEAADLCEDGVLDVFDLCLMKRKLITE